MQLLTSSIPHQITSGTRLRTLLDPMLPSSLPYRLSFQPRVTEAISARIIFEKTFFQRIEHLDEIEEQARPGDFTPADNGLLQRGAFKLFNLKHGIKYNIHRDLNTSTVMSITDSIVARSLAGGVSQPHKRMVAIIPAIVLRLVLFFLFFPLCSPLTIFRLQSPQTGYSAGVSTPTIRGRDMALENMSREDFGVFQDVSRRRLKTPRSMSMLSA